MKLLCRFQFWFLRGKIDADMIKEKKLHLDFPAERHRPFVWSKKMSKTDLFRTRARLSLLAVVGVGVFSVTTGCHHAPKLSGESSIRFVELNSLAPNHGNSDAEPAAAQTKEYRDVLPLRDLTKPVYPADALKAKAGWATVGVQVTIDTTGHVSAVHSSMVTLSTPGPFVASFRQAVEDALKEWRFSPAEIRHLEEASAPDGTTWKRITKVEKVERVLEIAFTFTADGRVN